MRGQFITIEGGEGVGKSTLINALRKKLDSVGIAFQATREPGGTPLAESIRKLVLANREEALPDTAELLLLFAARAVHINNLIEPALARGEWVICDRFTDATYAYQGAGREMDADWIARLETDVQQGLTPNLTLLLDAPVDVGLARAHARSKPDRFEREQQAFFERVRAAYLARAKAEPKRFVVLDATQTPERVQQQALNALDEFIAVAAPSSRHSRAGGNPSLLQVDSRLRGNDKDND